jgi:hypothetical protein
MISVVGFARPGANFHILSVYELVYIRILYTTIDDVITETGVFTLSLYK